MPNSTQNRKRKAAPAPLDPNAPYSTIEAIGRHRGPMSVEELAPLLGISRMGLYRMVKSRRIPRMVMPGSALVRFDPASICHWLRKHNPSIDPAARAS